ncbi:hypothetical protein PVAP13_9NG525214 [Panicum virgatum]|uniref:Uncharacterized protein n=1 Tax=Panicum virgatum TaxID=38727 RepID=A0A8T0MV82_PANVG|nr:hypothetical protein PVAP13_9NG525214 [Panicum virgatum]
MPTRPPVTAHAPRQLLPRMAARDAPPLVIMRTAPPARSASEGRMATQRRPSRRRRGEMRRLPGKKVPVGRYCGRGSLASTCWRRHAHELELRRRVRHEQRKQWPVRTSGGSKDRDRHSRAERDVGRLREREQGRGEGKEKKGSRKDRIK